MPDESALRANAREAIRAGKLPNRRHDRTWAAPGVGALCTICGESATKDQLEFEIQFVIDGAGAPGLDRFHIHIRCFAAWEFERTNGDMHSLGRGRAPAPTHEQSEA
jgi:hypothetical protein